MTSEKRNILNRLLQAWPHGSVVVTSWLKSQGAYQQLVHEYEKNGWIRHVGRGAYVRAGDVFDWKGGLNAVQNQLGLPVHIADKTALQLQGYAHFLPLGTGGILSLFGRTGTRLPTWSALSDKKPGAFEPHFEEVPHASMDCFFRVYFYLYALHVTRI